MKIGEGFKNGFWDGALVGTAIALMAAPVLSVFLYAFFDITLWAKIVHGDAMRVILIFVTHISSFILGLHIMVDWR